MNTVSKMATAAMLAIVAGATYQRRKQRTVQQRRMRMTMEQAHRLLTRAAPLIRLPTAPDRIPEVLPDGRGLRCPGTGRVYPYRNGILDLLEHEPTLTETQHLLNTAFTAWAYDRGRDALFRLSSGLSFAQEVAITQAQLQVQPDDTLLDLACGQGNFTVEWAQRTGEDGLTIGLDISHPMLQRAAMRITQAQRTNILLIRGDALHLPFADHVFNSINCSGGFHQLPDLPKALHELSRVSTSHARLAASTFAEGPNDMWAACKHWLKRRFQFHFVPLDWLETQLAHVGYGNYHATLPGGWFGYISARKVAADALDRAAGA